MTFPPNWDGPQPPVMPQETIMNLLKSLDESGENIRELLEEIVEMEKISFEIEQISYHRICGGGSIIIAPVNGDKLNKKQYNWVCAKCGVIRTVTLPENQEMNWSSYR